METRMKEFLERAGAQEYENEFEGVSLDYLMSLPFGEINEFLLQRVTKEEVRNSIKEEINIEFSRRRDEKEGIHVLEKKAKMEPEVFTIDVEEDLEHSPKPCSFSEMRKKPRMEEGLKLRDGSSPDSSQSCRQVPSTSGLQNGKAVNSRRSKRCKRIFKRSQPSDESSLPVVTQEDQEMISLQIVLKSGSCINGTYKLSWRDWAKRHLEGSLKPSHIAKLSVRWHYPKYKDPVLCSQYEQFGGEDFLPGLQEEEEYEPLTRWLEGSFPNLKVLEVFGDVGNCVQHWDALQGIMKKTDGALEEINFLFKEDNDYGLMQFLMIMSEIEDPYLSGLKVFRLKNKCKDIGLIAEHWGYLKEISAPSLEVLDIEFGFWMEDGTAENFVLMCRNFAKSLTTLIIHGCFYTNKKELPSVVLDLPRMPKLKLLDLGQSCQLLKVVENLEERPKKRRRKFVAIRQEEGKEGNGQDQDIQMQDGQEAETHGNYFSATLKLPLLERLESITLSMLYEIQEPHFFSFPKLKKFLVASDWNKTVGFPEPTSRHFLYRDLLELRFPNELEDPSFPALALQHFPNLNTIHIDMPTVDVVRGLAETLSEENTCPMLRTINLRMQFEFLSSFEACILNEPWSVQPSEEEFEKVAILKGYEHFEEYATVNRIQLPKYGQILLPNYEDGKRGILLRNEQDRKGKGLEALREKLFSPKKRTKGKAYGLVLECNPHKLRLPKGTQHFNDDGCEFTNTLLGFDINELPISRNVAARIPGNWAFNFFDISKSWMYFNVEAYHVKEEDINVEPLQLPPKPEKGGDNF